MARDTVSLRLTGEVPLVAFAAVLEQFSELLKALAEEIAGANEIEWEIAHLQSGSALATVRGMRAEMTAVEQVVHAYAIVGQALEQRRPIPYSEEVAQRAIAITAVLNDHIKAVEFVTDEYSAIVQEAVLLQEHAARKRYAIGTISGTVNAIWDRPRLRLGLYDPLFDRVVYCYLHEDQEDLARHVWGSRVRVTGLVFRDPISGRPIEVGKVQNVELLANAPLRSYKQARGVLPWQPGDEPAEVAIRRVRDAS